MSRCFPYPPPGYAVNRDSEEALIESIKLQKGREKAKAERKKEKKRDKKERQRERESNEKPDDNEFAHDSKRKINAKHSGKLEAEQVDLKSTQSQKNVTSDASEPEKERFKTKAERKKEKKQQKKDRKREKEANVKLDPSESLHGRKRKLNEEETRKWETQTIDLKSSRIQNVGEDEAELERSGITEEHDPPVCSQNPCNSSDSTNCSNKRRQLSPVTGISAHGNILKIRLSVQNQSKSDDEVSKERLCSASGITDSTGQQRSLSLRNDQGCSTSGIARDSLFGAPVASTHRGRKIQKTESRYHELVKSWVPPPLETLQMDLDEEDWLFQSKHQTDRERPKTCSDAAYATTGSTWARAGYLAEVDVYALPFTVPF